MFRPRVFLVVWLTKQEQQGYTDLLPWLSEQNSSMAALHQQGILKHKTTFSTAELTEYTPSRSGLQWLEHNPQFDVMLVKPKQAREFSEIIAV